MSGKFPKAGKGWASMLPSQ
jgi:4-hydroxy-3-polyprenylbenzoate decarboxylase